MRVALITNIPTPYRDPVYLKLSQYKEIVLYVLFCGKSEPNRAWDVDTPKYNHIFLSYKRNRFVHLNWNIYKELTKINPDVLINAGFNPTMLLAWFWSLIKKRKHITFSDANINSESILTWTHKIVRKLVFRTSHAFIGASEKTLDLYREYNISDEKLFKSCLAVENKIFSEHVGKKKYDLMYCGQFIDRKNPMFFAKLTIQLSEIFPNIRILLVGDGPLKTDCVFHLRRNNINFCDAGFIQPNEIVELYKLSKIFIFPTKRDPWGLVANEALAAGVPVFVTSIAGVSNELVIDGYNGYVFENFDTNEWVLKIKILLEDDGLYFRMSDNARESVQRYTYDIAAEGIFESIQFVLK